MQYSFDTQNAILAMSKKQLSGRHIARLLDVSKSGVNYFLGRQEEEEMPKSQGPKILLFDLETSAALVYAFGRHKQYINQDAVYKEGGRILMASYRWLHEKETHILVDKAQIKQGLDFNVTLALWELFSEADAVVAHNGRNFDVKMLEAACLRNDIMTLPTVHILDTLEIAKKKFRLPSNKLDSLGAFIQAGRKVSHSGIDLWVKVQQGDEDAIAEMVEYCIQDTELLHEVFIWLRSRGLVSGFNAANYYDDNKTRCKTCGSEDLEYTGRMVTTPTGKFKEIRCNTCNSVQRNKTDYNSRDKRKSLTASPKN